MDVNGFWFHFGDQGFGPVGQEGGGVCCADEVEGAAGLGVFQLGEGVLEGGAAVGHAAGFGGEVVGLAQEAVDHF